MTENIVNEDVFANLTVSRVLVAILETLGEVVVPTNILLDNAENDKKIQLDYNSDNQTFTLKLREESDEPAAGNN